MNIETPLSPPDKVTCEKVTSFIMEYVNQDLPPEVMQVFDRHIQKCDDCVAFLSTYRQTVTAVSALTYDDIPPDLQARAMDVIRRKAGG